jgi:type II secretory pathway pseudopilin PulG
VEIIVTSVVAVVGTLLGSLATHYFQRRNRADAERFERGERLRQERVSAYTTYGGALVSLRRALIDRWYAAHEERRNADPDAIRYETYRLRTVALEAMFRVQLVTESQQLIGLAQAAIDSVDRLHLRVPAEEFKDARDVSRQAIFDFVEAARQHVEVA